MFGLFGKISKDDFAALVLKRVKAGGGPTDYRFDPAEFTFFGSSGRVYLGNAYASYCAAKGEHRKTILDNFVGLMRGKTAATPDFDKVRSKLTAVVRETFFLSASTLFWQQTPPQNPDKPFRESISRWFSKALVLDEPGSMMLVNESNFKEWGVLPD